MERTNVRCYGVDGHIKLALLETQIIELLAHGLRELRNNFAAFGGKVFARTQQLRVKLFQFRIQPR
jgi:hypothetical protein